MQFVNLAKDGASTADILHDQMPQLEPGDRNRTLITITGGGNDILTHQAGPDEVLFRVRAILDRLNQLFPDCEIVLGTTYDPTDGVGDLFGEEIHERELRSLHGVNDEVRKLAAPPQLRIAEIHKHFLGHGIHAKDPSNPYFHPEDPSLWYVLTIEPNSRGAHEIRALFWKALYSGQTLSAGK
jgi:lysophospholipase L1-like esterase